MSEREIECRWLEWVPQRVGLFWFPLANDFVSMMLLIAASQCIICVVHSNWPQINNEMSVLQSSPSLPAESLFGSWAIPESICLHHSSHCTAYASLRPFIPSGCSVQFTSFISATPIIVNYYWRSALLQTGAQSDELMNWLSLWMTEWMSSNSIYASTFASVG